MQTLESYIGIKPWTVLVDDSPELRQLAERARELRGKPFPEQLAGIKQLVLEGNVNAYERMKTTKGAEQKKFERIVMEPRPLSVALQERALCCRYQGALFFVLGYEAEMGDHHFVEAAPVKPGWSTVFNDILVGAKPHRVSMFTESLEDKSLDYTHINPNLFKQLYAEMPGFNFYSYHRTRRGFQLIANPNQHISKDALVAFLKQS